MSENQNEPEFVEPGEEVTGDKAPVLRPAQLAQPSAEYKPTDPFGDSIVLTATSPLYLGQLRFEISEATGVPEADIQVAYSAPDSLSPVSKSNEAKVFIKIKGGGSVTQKTLAKVLAAHTPSEPSVGPEQPVQPVSVNSLDGEAAALADKARSGETLSTKELSSLLGALLG